MSRLAARIARLEAKLAERMERSEVEVAPWLAEMRGKAEAVDPDATAAAAAAASEEDEQARCPRCDAPVREDSRCEDGVCRSCRAKLREADA